jgi:hypothetical protein
MPSKFKKVGGVRKRVSVDMSREAKERRKAYKRRMKNPSYRRKVQLAREKYYRKNKKKIQRQRKMRARLMKAYGNK